MITSLQAMPGVAAGMTPTVDRLTGVTLAATAAAGVVLATVRATSRVLHRWRQQRLTERTRVGYHRLGRRPQPLPRRRR